MKKYLVLLLCLCFLILGIQFFSKDADARKKDKSEKSETPSEPGIEIEGMADIREAGLSEAYDRALKNAQRRAIEKVLGTIYSAKAVVESSRLIEDIIITKTEGYIKKYKIINKWQEGELAIVRISAQVGKDKLKQDTLAIEEVQQKMSRPRTAIFIDEIMIGKSDKSTSAVSYSLIAEMFIKKGFNIVERVSISQEILNKFLKTSASGIGFTKMAYEIGNKIGADIIISGKVITEKGQKVEVYGVELNPTKADMTIKAVNIDDGRILATITKSGSFPIQTSERDASIRAINSIASNVSDKLITGILKSWEDILNNGNELTLNTKGLDLKQGYEFESALKRYYREVVEVHNKGKSGDIITYTVKFLGNANDMARALSLKDCGFKINDIDFEMNTVDINISR